MCMRSTLPLAALLMVVTSWYSASAAPGDSASEASALASVTVSPADAIAAVEAKGTGKVVEMVLLSEGAAAVYQITTLMPDGTETNYAVDAKTGSVVTTVDVHDEDGDDDHDRDERNSGDEDH